MTAERISIMTWGLTGGALTNVSLDLAGGLVEHGVPVDVLCLRSASTPAARSVPHGVEVHPLPVDRARWVIVPLLRYLSSRRPALLISLGWLFNTSAVVAARLTNTPVLVREAASLSYKAGVEHHQDPILKRLDRAARLVYPRAEGVVGNSEGVLRDLLDQVGVSVAAHRTRAIHNPVDLARIQQGARDGSVPSEHRRAPRPWFVNVARLERQKNHLLLVDAFARFLDKHGRGTLFIVGDGALRAMIELRVHDLGIEDRVFLVGRQQNPYPYVASADGFVLTSEEEGFGLVLVEAMALGTPVVCAACPGGAREVLGEPPAGIWVDPPSARNVAAAMAALAGDADLAADLRARGLNRASEFSPRRIAAAWLRFASDLGIRVPRVR